MGKQKDILDSLQRMNEERENKEKVNEQLDEDVDWNKVQNAVENYKKDVDKALSKYSKIVESEISDRYLEALVNAKRDLLMNDARRMSYVLSWMDIIDSTQVESYIESNL